MSRHRVTRRRLLASSLTASLGLLTLPAAAEDAGTDAMASLGAVLDGLLPADALSPSATGLGVDDELRTFLAGQEMLTQLISLGLGWMDRIGGRPFRELSPMRQAAILAQMEASDPNHIPGRCYHILRALAVEFYYARAEALGGLPLDPAPQPHGYPPPWG